MASINRRPNGTWRARYRDDTGREHARHFGRRATAQAWLDEQTVRLVAGTHDTPRQARTTVGEWCDTWLGYRGHRPSTVRQAEVHIPRIRTEFGRKRLSDIRPSHVRTCSWRSRRAHGARRRRPGGNGRTPPSPHGPEA